MRQSAFHNRFQDRCNRFVQDDVTGLATRRFAERQLASMLARAAEQETGVAVVHIDIDRLKEINHALGRPMGDACLKETGRRIVEATGSTGIVARLDSDELMVVLPEVSGLWQVIPVVERLIERTREPLELLGHSVLSSCCAGLALFPDHGTNVTELMRHANLARHEAQGRGNGRYCVFTRELLEEGPDRLQLRCELHDALSRGEIVLNYRPLLCARSRQVMAVSSEPCWHSTRLGKLKAVQWMPAAREMGQLPEIYHWILTRACRQAHSWYQAGSGLRVVVAVPAEGLLGDDLIESVRCVLASSGLPKGLLELELSEDGLMRDPEHAGDLLERLKAMGVRLSVAGFGSGQSMLGHLGLFPIDTLKLDALFVDNCLDNPRHQAVIRSVINMAHELGIRVAAGGVSTRHQADFLREQGCDLLEGSLWSRMEYTDSLS